MTTVLWWLLLPLVAVLGAILWATESRSTRINRLRRSGATWATIATRYGVSSSTVRRWASA
jgi:DNA-binding transcriptional regulator YiaG